MAILGLSRYLLSKYGKASTSIYYNGSVNVVAMDHDTLVVSWVPITPDPIDTAPTHWKLLKTYGSTPDNINSGFVVEEDVIDSFRIQYVDTEFETSPTQEIFYSLWVYNPTTGWIFCGSAGTFIVPPSDTLTNVINWIPRAWTTESGEVTSGEPETSDFSKMLSSFTFEYDSLRADIDALGKFSGGNTIPSILLPQKVLDLGFNNEPSLGDPYHRTMYQTGQLIHQTKGTKESITKYVKALTHLNSVVEIGHNLLLDYNDASFEESTGRWEASSGTLTSALFSNSLDEIGTAIIAPILDVVHDVLFPPRALGYGQLSTTSTTPVVMTLPGAADNVVTYGIPVVGSTRYIFSGWVTRVTNNVTISATISWYNYLGGLISTTASGTTVTATTDWKEFTTLSDGVRDGVESPRNASYAKINLTITPSSASQEYVALDLLQFSKAEDSLEYQDARLVEVYIDGEQSNYALTPDFGSGTGFWTPINGSLIQNALAPSTAVVFNDSVAQLTSIASGVTAITSDWVAVDPGESYTFSIYASGPVGRLAVARIEFPTGETLADQDLILEDVDGKYYASESYVVESDPVVLTATAQKISVTATVPPYTRDSGQKVAKITVYISDLTIDGGTP